MALSGVRNSCDMLARNCDFSADACSSSMCCRRSSSFCCASSAVASWTLRSSSAERLLQLLVEARLLDRLGEVVQDRHDPDQLALLRQDRAGQRLDRQRPAGRRIGQLNLAAIALLARPA